jgi:hypothetical protein
MHQLFTSLLFTSGLDPEVKTLFMKDTLATQKVSGSLNMNFSSTLEQKLHLDFRSKKGLKIRSKIGSKYMILNKI